MKKIINIKIKAILLLLITLICTQKLVAQKESLTTQVPEFMQNADYVFEGTVIDTKRYFTKDGNAVYASCIVQITKIFKGFGLKLGTIQVLTEVVMGEIPSRYEGELPISLGKPSHGFIFKVEANGQSGIFAVKAAKSNENNYKWNNVELNNSIILSQGNKRQYGSIPYCLSCYEGKYRTPWGDFDTKIELYKSIQKFNFKTDFIDKQEIEEKNIIEKQQLERQKGLIELEKRIATEKKSIELGKQQNKKKAQQKLKTIGNLNFDVRNTSYSTSSGSKYLDFDVYIWGSQPSFFNFTILRFNFDKQAFGDSVYVNQNLVTTKGTSFNNINYKILSYYFPQDSIVSISFATNDALANPSRIAVSTTPLQLMHLRFKIKNCQSTAKMLFTDIALCDLLTDYKLTSNEPVAGSSYSYDNIYRTDHSPLTLCPKMAITNFSPSVIRAGTNEILTISGRGFGNTRGIGQVLFPSADQVGRYLLGCDAEDYTIWNDTLVKVKVPSIAYVDSPYYSGAATGIIKIVTDDGSRDSTLNKLDVEYSIENYNKGAKTRVNWSMKGCKNYAYTFKLGQTLAAYPEAVVIIDSAI